MDRHDAVPATENALTPWTARHAAFLDGLDEVLDVEAGLADAFLPDQRTDLVTGLDEVLDVEGGLAAILPAGTIVDPPPAVSDQAMTGPAAEPPAHAAGTAASHRYTLTTFQRLATAVSQTDPRTRLTLRTDPRFSGTIIAVRLSLVLARAHAITSYLKLEPDLDLDFDRARALVRDLVRDLARALVHDLDRARARALVHTLDRAFDLVRARTSVLIYDFDRARASVLVRDLASARDLVRDLVHDLDLSRSRSRSRTRLVRGDLLVLDLDRDLDLVLVPDLDLDLDLDRDVAALRREQDNFLHADLSGADLEGVDLEGLLWSKTATQWPPNWAGWIEANSVEVEPGIYQVGPGRRHADADLALH